ncbi:MAG: Ppx/GppA family phosphatase [Bdellovibrionales bacterium]|jgi:exopolyphosphatase/guanosine-5'-triphosphate,3'-diphosphate pyrophosphatase|nr:Ppx/GppA family phosphatase [Bdellovibrionales bacterium]
MAASVRQRIAGLDLGTNTFLCLIADFENGLLKEVIRDEVRVVRLGQGVHASRELHPDALARAEETFREFHGYIREAGCDRVLAVATSAARDVRNGQLLVELGQRYEIPIEIISGEKEAELTFAGALDPAWQGLTAVIDVGGGSTEIIFGDQSGVKHRFSADVGSVRLTEMFVTEQPIAKTQLEAMRMHVREVICKAVRAGEEALGGKPQIQQVVAVAGTPTTLAAVDSGRLFQADVIHGYSFTESRLEEWIQRLADLSVAERQALAGMEPKRADVIVAGAICVSESLKALEKTAFTVSIRGLRYGVARWCATRE